MIIDTDTTHLEDYSEPSLYRAYIRVARKKHKCSECSGDILPGESYEAAKGKWDGEWSRFQTCPMCLSFRERHGITQWIHGRLLEDYDYKFDESPVSIGK